MRISFDLDDTLFVSEEKFKVEAPLRFPFCAIYKERLRLGTIALMKHFGNRAWSCGCIPLLFVLNSTYEVCFAVME